MNSKGFSLIETVIVFFIVGVLAAVCPSFDGGIAWGLLVAGAAPMIAMLLRRAKLPVAVCAAAGFGLFVCGLALIGKAVPDSPSFGRVVRRANERQARIELSRVRRALEAHRKEKGAFPRDLSALAGPGKFLPSLPAVKTPPAYAPNAAVRLGSSSDGTGGWLYDGDQASPTFGRVWVNCTATDTEGAAWTAY